MKESFEALTTLAYMKAQLQSMTAASGASIQKKKKRKQDRFRKKEKIKRGTETEREINEEVKKRIEKEIKF